MKRLAIVQSCYIPWKGYFDLIDRADTFILYDTVQYTKQDWRNRNRIQTAQGLHWLTVPVRHQHLGQRICDVWVSDPQWAMRHWQTVRMAYRKAPYFRDYAPAIENLYAQSAGIPHLSDVNFLWLKEIGSLLGIHTPLVLLRSFERTGDKSLDLINLCTAHGADTYISGPAAKDYLDVAAFASHGINVEWMDYAHYKPYPTIHAPFEHHVSILDLLFNTGARAMEYFRQNR